MVIRFIGVTMRFELEDRSGATRGELDDVFLFAFWHNRILMMPWFYIKVFPKRKLSVMISRSKDGQLITEVANQFGVDGARGSSSKKGVTAFIELVHYLKKEARDVAMTPDGPRGPMYSIQPGILQLARLGRLPIIPVSCEYSSYWEAKSWDRFQVPKPFCSCKLILHEPVRVPEKADDTIMFELEEELKAKLQ